MGHSVSSLRKQHTNMIRLTSWLSFVVLLAGVTGQSYNYETPGYSYEAPSQHSEEVPLDPLARMALNIHGGGTPGVDYPILSTVPATGFSCSDYSYSGYFADTSPQSRCQVFHMCHSDGLHDAFLCPNGTIFNQQTFVLNFGSMLTVLLLLQGLISTWLLVKDPKLGKLLSQSHSMKPQFESQR